MDSCAVDSTIVKNWREHPPCSYSVKINKLSQLDTSRYESPCFSSGGYNWRLVIFPKGNEKENGSGYISMYVELDSTNLKSEPATEVFAYLTFFIYSKKENKYFTIHDVEVSRFNATRLVWGLPQVLPSATFNDPQNGFIFDGEHCEFGVDLVDVSAFKEWERASFYEELDYSKFSWSVKNVSEFNEKSDLPSRFSMGGRNWTLKLYPKGESVEVDGWVSLEMHLADDETLMADEKIYVRANLRVIDSQGSNNNTKKVHSWFERSSRGWSFGRFFLLSKLREDYLNKEGSLNVEIEFEVFYTTKYSPII